MEQSTSTLHSAHHMEGRAKRHHPVRTTIIVIVVVLACAVGGYAYALTTSMNTLKTDLKQMSADYKTLTTQIVASNASGANSTAIAIASQVDKVQTETNSWVWNVAAAVPVYGEDVKTMRTLVGVSNDLADQVAVPVTEKYSALLADGVIDGSGNLDAGKLVAKVGEVSDMISVLQRAKTVVTQCDQTVKNLPVSHFEELNEGIASAREGVDSLNTSFQAIDPMLQQAGQVEESVTSLLYKLGDLGINL